MKLADRSVGAGVGLGEVTFAFRDSPFMRRLSHDFEERAPETPISLRVVPKTTPYPDCYDPEKVSLLLGAFHDEIVVSDPTLFHALSKNLPERPLRAYDALPQIDPRRPLQALIEHVADVVAEVRERELVPVLVEQSLADHLIPIGVNSGHLGTVDNREILALTREYTDERSRTAYVRFVSDARAYANVLEKQLDVPVIRQEQFCFSYEHDDQMSGNVRAALRQLGLASQSMVLLGDHHLLRLVPHARDLGFADIPIVLVCPCCIGARSMDHASRNPVLLPLERTGEWERTLETLSRLIGAERHRRLRAKDS